jgi:hypothetical protein
VSDQLILAGASGLLLVIAIIHDVIAARRGRK